MPQRIHQESLEWMTNVIRAKAKEQRICLREAPRHAYELHYLMDAQQFVRAKLIARVNPQVNAPLWDDMTRIDAVAAGATSLAFNTTQSRYTNQAIIWESDEKFEVVTIDSITPTGIVWSGGLVNDYVNAIVAPLEPCWFTQPFGVMRYLKEHSLVEAHLITTDTRILGTQPLAPPSTPVIDADVLLDCNVVMGGTLEEAYGREHDEFDSESGVMWKDDAYRYPLRSTFMSWHTQDKSTLWNLREWLNSVRGRWKGFWVPSWNNDLEIVTDITAAGIHIDIKAIGFAKFAGVRDAMILTTLGARHYIHIELADDTIAAGFETLQLSDPVGVDLAVADIMQCSLLTFSRLNTDRVEIQHEDGGKAMVTVPIMETSTI